MGQRGAPSNNREINEWANRCLTRVLYLLICLTLCKIGADYVGLQLNGWLAQTFLMESRFNYALYISRATRLKN